MNHDMLDNKTLPPLETYEWDSVWWEHADTEGVPRILYIGDSISRDTRKAVVRLGVTELYVDGIATSKSLDNPYFKDLVRMFVAQEKENPGSAVQQCTSRMASGR